MVTTYGALMRQTARALEAEEGPRADFTARALMTYLTGKDTAQLLAMQNLFLPEELAEQYQALAERILTGEPLAYILGQWDFYGQTYTVTPEVLIPRDDTMAVVDLILERRHLLPQNPRILDLCTGSGCIGLTLAARIKTARVTLADLSPGALKIAKKNTVDQHLTARVSCLTADAMVPASRFLGQFDVLISNPPYVTAAEMAALPRSVRDFEPAMALDGGPDGLDFYRAIAKNFTPAIKPGGYLALEFGMGQEDAVSWILEAWDYDILELKKDAGDITRAILAQKKERD